MDAALDLLAPSPAFPDRRLHEQALHASLESLAGLVNACRQDDKPRLNPVAQCRVLAHEMAHELVHQAERERVTLLRRPGPR